MNHAFLKIVFVNNNLLLYLLLFIQYIVSATIADLHE